MTYFIHILLDPRALQLSYGDAKLPEITVRCDLVRADCYFELGTWGALASSLRRKSALTSIAFEGAKRCLLGDATLLLNGSSLALVCKTSSAMYR